MTAGLLEQARRKLGLTTRQAGELLGLSRSTISSAERRGDAISVGILRRMAAGYGYRLDVRLVGETGEVIVEGEPGGGREQEAGRMARGAAGGD